MNMGKLLLLTLNEQEETAIDKIISAISNYMRLEPMQLTPVSVLSFPGLEIYSFYYPPLQAYLQYKKSFHYISNPSCVGLITALCSLSNSNIVISFLIMFIGTLLHKSKFL